MKRAYVDIPTGQIHYRTEGSGDPVILLHQSGSSSKDFSPLISMLSPRYQVIAPDYPGHGQSDPPSYLYKVPDFARTVLSFMDALGIPSAHIMGDTTGSTVAAEIAASAPERVSSLVLHLPPYWKHPGNRLRSFEFFPIKEMEIDGSHVLRKWEMLAKQANTTGVSIEQMQELLIRLLRNQLQIKRGEDGHYAVFTYDIQPRLPLIKNPTLVLTREKGLFQRRAQDVKDAIPRSKLHTLSEHASLIPNHEFGLKENAQEYGDALLAFLSDPGV